MSESSDRQRATSDINQVMVWVSTVTGALAVMGVGYVVSEISTQDTRLTQIEASRFSIQDAYRQQEVERQRWENYRGEFQEVKDRVKDLENQVKVLSK